MNNSLKSPFIASFILVFSFLIMVPSLMAQTEIPAPRVLFAVHNFFDPEDGAYVELNLSFDASSLAYEKRGDFYQSRIEVLYVIKKNESVIKYEKFEILSPRMYQASNRQDFGDIQNITLFPGVYTLEVSIWDKNRDIEPIRASQQITVDLTDRHMAMSDFVFEKSVVASEEEGEFVKNGLLMTPWLVSTLPAYMSEIYLYSEVYHSDFELGASGAYIEKHTLRNLDVDSVFENYSVTKRVNSAPVNIILKRIDLSNLPEGLYSYNIELFNRSNQLVGSNGKQFYRESFIPQLSKQYRTAQLKDFETHIRSTTNRDTIVDYFRCIRPLGERADQNFIDNNWRSASSEVLQSFLINYWIDHNPTDPFKEWLKYRGVVAAVDKKFGSAAKEGYDTDMGMTYLSYGKPDQITDRANEPSSYPYVIWQYYAHPKQSNAMYVFYDPSLTFRDYQLLHSNVRDEKNNPRWKLVLQSRNNANGDVDKSQGVDHWGSQVDEYYTNPR